MRNVQKQDENNIDLKKKNDKKKEKEIMYN